MTDKSSERTPQPGGARRFSRRDFLKLGGAAVGGAVIGVAGLEGLRRRTTSVQPTIQPIAFPEASGLDQQPVTDGSPEIKIFLEETQRILNSKDVKKYDYPKGTSPGGYQYQVIIESQDGNYMVAIVYAKHDRAITPSGSNALDSLKINFLNKRTGIAGEIIFWEREDGTLKLANAQKTIEPIRQSGPDGFMLGQTVEAWDAGGGVAFYLANLGKGAHISQNEVASLTQLLKSGRANADLTNKSIDFVYKKSMKMWPNKEKFSPLVRLGQALPAKEV